MQRTVEEIVTRFGVVGLGDTQAAFAATAAALGVTSEKARASARDVAAAGDAVSAASRKVDAANAAMRDGMAKAEAGAKSGLAETIRQAEAREKAAREAMEAARVAAEKAQKTYQRAPVGASATKTRAAEKAARSPEAGAADAAAVQAAREAVAAAKARHDEVVRLAEDEAKAEEALSKRRAEHRTAALRRELAEVEAAGAERAAAMAKAQAKLDKTDPKYAKRIEELYEASRLVDSEDPVERARRGDIMADKSSGIGGSLAFKRHKEATAELEAARAMPGGDADRAAIEARIAAVEAEERKKAEVARAAAAERAAAERQAVVEAEQALEQQVAAAKAAAAARVEAARVAIDEEVRAAKERTLVERDSARAAEAAAAEELAKVMQANAAEIAAAEKAGAEQVRMAAEVGAADVKAAEEALDAFKEKEAAAVAAERAQREAAAETARAQTAAGDAVAAAARKVADATAAMRKGVADADVAGKADVAETVRKAQEREKAAREVAAAARAEAARAQKEYQKLPSRPRGTGGLWSPLDDEVYEKKQRAKDHRDSASAMAAIADQELAKVKRANAAEITLAKQAAEERIRLAKEVGGEALKAAEAELAALRRKEGTALSAEKAQQAAARETQRVQEAAAKATAKAWKDAADRMGAVRKALPKLGVLTPVTGGASSVYSSLTTKGLLPTAWGLGGKAIAGAYGVGSAAVGALTGMLGLVGKVGGGILGIAGSAVKAGASLVYHLGAAAVSLLEKLGSAAVGVGGKIVGVAKNLAVRGALVGGIAAVAAARGAQKAVADSADDTRETYGASVSSGTGLGTYQLLAAAARRAGVATGDFTRALQASQQAMSNIAQDPALLSYFERLGVSTRTADGRLRDTSSVLQELLPRIQQLSSGEQQDLLTKLFGSRENWVQILPLIGSLVSNDGLLGRAAARQAFLGNVVTADDVVRMRAYQAATSDVEDAWKGLKLTVARGVTPYVIQGFGALADMIGRNREKIAAMATTAADLSGVLFRVARDGVQAAQTINPAAYFGSPLVKFLIDTTLRLRIMGYAVGVFATELRQAIAPDTTSFFDFLGKAAEGTRDLTLWAVQVGREFILAFRGISQQRTELGQVMIPARRWIIDVAEGLYKIGLAAKATMPFWHDLYAAAMGRDKEVTTFPGLLAARDALAMVGRVAKETWYAVSGHDERVQEFPILLKIRDAIVAAVAWARELGRELWLGVSGQDAPENAQFPWIFSARQAIYDFVAYVKAVWADLQNVWHGGSGDTGLGQWARWAIDVFNKVKDGFVKAYDTVKLVWADLEKVFSGQIGKGDKFNFDWIKTVAQDVQWFGEKLSQAWSIFSAIFSGINDFVKTMFLGKVDAETLILVGTLATLLGVTRTVTAAVAAGTAAAGYIKTAAGAATTAVGTGGAGLVGAVATLGKEAGKMETSVGKAQTAWGKFGDKVAGLAGRFGPLQAALAGLAGTLLKEVAPNSLFAQLAGGALQGGAVGAMLGSSFGPWGTAIGGVAGAAYGAYSSYSQMGQKDEAPAKTPLPPVKDGDGHDPYAVREFDPNGQAFADETFYKWQHEAEIKAAAEKERMRNWERERAMTRDSNNKTEEALERLKTGGKRAELDPSQSVFTIVTRDGVPRRFSGASTDVAAVRDTTQGQVPAPRWQTA